MRWHLRGAERLRFTMTSTPVYTAERTNTSPQCALLRSRHQSSDDGEQAPLTKLWYWLGDLPGPWRVLKACY
jgi:hypothetical protein